jgi:hypothetical protein
MEAVVEQAGSDLSAVMPDLVSKMRRATRESSDAGT